MNKCHIIFNSSDIFNWKTQANTDLENVLIQYVDCDIFWVAFHFSQSVYTLPTVYIVWASTIADPVFKAEHTSKTTAGIPSRGNV